ncbi:MAG: bifunctional oligoribonuclease/PAP phosphatase NrnA, partial [Synergistaceae bacterium]
MSSSYSDTKKAIISAMTDHGAWLIISHENPDGDTIGCAVALYSLGCRLGKDVRLICKSRIPQRYLFVPNAQKYAVTEQLENIGRECLIICVDTSTEARSVDGVSKFRDAGVLTVNIDHHGDNTMYGSLNLVDADASATAEVVEDIFASAGWGMTKEESSALYVALSTDNGNFRFHSTTARSHMCAARLLESGADPAELDDCVNENWTQDILKLWGKAFLRTEISCEGRAALFWLTDSDFAEASADASSTEGLVNMLMRIEGIKIAVFLCEYSGAKKISVRTRPPFNAREFASAFGGGGHPQAAGAKIGGSLSDLRNELVKYAADRHTANR